MAGNYFGTTKAEQDRQDLAAEADAMNRRLEAAKAGFPRNLNPMPYLEDQALGAQVRVNEASPNFGQRLNDIFLGTPQSAQRNADMAAALKQVQNPTGPQTVFDDNAKPKRP